MYACINYCPPVSLVGSLSRRMPFRFLFATRLMWLFSPPTHKLAFKLYIRFKKKHTDECDSVAGKVWPSEAVSSELLKAKLVDLTAATPQNNLFKHTHTRSLQSLTNTPTFFPPFSWVLAGGVLSPQNKLLQWWECSQDLIWPSVEMRDSQQPLPSDSWGSPTITASRTTRLPEGQQPNGCLKIEKKNRER